MKILAITPARGGSKGVPRKNIKIINGRPLIDYTITSALECDDINRYIVNTEDEEIANHVKTLGVEVQSRPQEFWHDNTFQEVDRLLIWSVLQVESQGYYPDAIILLYPTSPFRTSNTIKKCIEKIKSGYDSVLTLCESRSYIWAKESSDEFTAVKPVNYDPKNRGPNQLEGWNQWVENKAVYVVKRDLLIDTGCRLGGKIGFVPMSKIDSVDIDTVDDFLLAESILKSRSLK